MAPSCLGGRGAFLLGVHPAAAGWFDARAARHAGAATVSRRPKECARQSCFVHGLATVGRLQRGLRPGAPRGACASCCVFACAPRRRLGAAPVRRWPRFPSLDTQDTAAFSLFGLPPAESPPWRTRSLRDSSLPFEELTSRYPVVKELLLAEWLANPPARFQARGRRNAR